MTIEKILSRTNENIDIEIRCFWTEEVLSNYDGKNSIDESYNQRGVLFIDIINNKLVLYVQERQGKNDNARTSKEIKR